MIANRSAFVKRGLSFSAAGAILIRRSFLKLEGSALKKNTVPGLPGFLLSAAIFSFLASVLGHSLGSGACLEPGGVLRAAGLILSGLVLATLFLASRGRRLRMVLTLAAGAAAGLLLGRLRLSAGPRVLAVLGIVGPYLLICVLADTARFRKSVQPLNEAVLAYQRDRDGAKLLEVLDRCARELPKETAVKKPGVGTITLWEHIACEKLRVLGDMGRLEERRELAQQLRRETKSPGLAAWLEEKEAEFQINKPEG